MHNNDWVKELNESYRNITNVQNINEVVLTEEQLNEHFANLAIIIESIENTFGIELTEEEIDSIDEQLQLNEFIGVLAKIGYHAGKRLLGKGLEVGGKTLAKPEAYKAARTQAITKAKEATKAAQDKALKAWEAGGRKGDIPFVKDIAPEMPKRGFLSSAGTKIQKFGKKLSPVVKDEEGKKLGAFRGGIRQAGYKGGWDATKAGLKQTGRALSTLATGAIGAVGALGMLGGEGEGGGRGKQRTSGRTETTRGDSGEYDTDWETASGYVRPTGTRPSRKPVRENHIDTLSQTTQIIVENLYEVKLTENTKNNLYANINRIFISHNETE